ncbi:MAG: TonB-dependent receptor [Novosphingobium sp.]|nr:TonB-dependent receptor [Novosphingobium sp.]MCP5403042.1 TonB-dependent receptor [Novosphingobium sp.]
MKHASIKFALVASTVLSPAAPALAQSGTNDATDIIVTARRSEERLQDVPISITVLSQDALTKRNIVSTADLGQYVPSLSTNSQFGEEKSSFVIRGFTQEGKTSPSVGVYFADVVAPRSFGGTTSGNGAGVGSLFDLQNVQVLKGPQGTLFGRNTTGGAILLVPTKPTDRLEGYVEGSVGNYDLRRVQAVLNVPLSDTFRVRLGVDRNKRDGFLKNYSGVGPDRFRDTDYIAARLSIVADLTPDLENYLIASYSKSTTNGDVSRMLACTDANGNPPDANIVPLAAALNPFACAQIARAEARGDGFWSVENANQNPYLRQRQWQVINTTTWQATDTLTVKNIVSYAEYREAASFSLFGDNFLFPAGPLAGQLFTKTIELSPGFTGDNSAQSTFTEELQLHGTSSDGRLDWQAGLYFELSKPLGFNSGLTGIFLNCNNTRTYDCTDPLGFGSISSSNVKNTFNNKGIYAQATYDLTEQLSLTGGIRYTIDKMTDLSQNLNIFVPTPGTGILTCQNQILFPGLVVQQPSECSIPIKQKWKRPTWLIDLDYKPTDDILLYLKWARGYRQGSINSNNLGLETVGPEKVDTYEVGAKTSFRGAVSGYFNLAAFYNKFRDQQLAVNSVVAPAFQGLVSPAQPIVNAGKSRIWGIEADASVRLFEGFRLDAAYAYLNTKLQSFNPPPTPVYYSILLPTADVGQSLALSPKNRITVSGTYTLPLDESIGEISFGATFTHTDANRAVAPSASPNFFLLKKSDLLNLNASWDAMFGSPVDLSFFMTNVTNEKRIVYPVTSLNTIGGEGGHLNQPRMWGFRLKYSFGE